MKKPQLSLLVLITRICAAFTLGFFIGRNQNRTEVLVHTPQINQTSPETTEPATTEAATAATAAATTVPTESTEAATETTSEPPADESHVDASGRININTATHAELMSLPGIGEVIAQRIIDYRTQYGDFRAVEELLNVSGIGAKKLEAILDLVTVGG